MTNQILPLTINELHLNTQAEKTSNSGIAEGYSEIINPLTKHLEDCIKSLEDADPQKYFNGKIVIEILSQIQLTANGLSAMMLNSIAGTNNCFLKQGKQ